MRTLTLCVLPLSIALVGCAQDDCEDCQTGIKTAHAHTRNEPARSGAPQFLLQVTSVNDTELTMELAAADALHERQDTCVATNTLVATPVDDGFTVSTDLAIDYADGGMTFYDFVLDLEIGLDEESWADLTFFVDTRDVDALAGVEEGRTRSMWAAVGVESKPCTGTAPPGDFCLSYTMLDTPVDTSSIVVVPTPVTTVIADPTCS